MLSPASVIARRVLGIPNRGIVRLIPLAFSVTPMFIVGPIWWWRTAWVRRAVRDSGWRLCTHCAYDVSALSPSGTCPECGNAYDVKRDAALWEQAGCGRPPM